MILKIDTLPMEELATLCRRHGIKELHIFGSALTEDFGTDSDIDFLVEFEADTPVGFLHLAKVEHELSDLLDRRVDLVPKAGLNPVIRKSVLESARPVYAA